MQRDDRLQQLFCWLEELHELVQWQGDQPELVGWLERSCDSPDETRQIIRRLEKYDVRTARESVFDSVATGEFDFSAS